MKRVLSLLVTFCMLILTMPVFAAVSADALWIPLDDVKTNDVPVSLTVSGSSNNRVIAENNSNKVLSLDVGYVSNEVSVPLPDTMDKSQYVIQFDAGFVTKAAGGQILLKTESGIEVVLLNISDDGIIITKDNKKIGGIGIGGRQNIAIMIDNVLRTYSVYINRRCVMNCWDLDVNAAKAVTFHITTQSGNGANSQLYLDNIRMYEGTAIKNNTGTVAFNTQESYFEETDESNIQKQIFVNAKLDNTNGKMDSGISSNAKSNRIEQLFDNSNGYLELEKLSNTDNLFVDVTVNTTVKKLVLECDVRYNTSPVISQLFYLRDSSGAAQVNKSILNFNGGSVTAGGKSAALKKKQWNTVSVVMNLSNGTFDAYVNGTVFAKDVATVSGLKNLSLWRIYIDNNASEGKLQIDNIRVYEGDERRDISNVKIEGKSIYSDSTALTALNGKTALQPYGNTIWVNNKKQKTDVPCIIKGDEALVSADTFEKLFGIKPDISGDTIKVGGAEFAVGSAEIKVGSKKYIIEAAPEFENGQVMIPARAYGINLLGDKFYDDEHGLFVVSSTPIDTSVNYQEANQYLFFDRYSKEELIQKFTESAGGNLKNHPRVLADADDFARIKEEIKTDEYKREWYKSVIKEADAYAADETEFMDYDVSSGRLTTCATSAEKECIYGGMAYQITGDKKYADRVIKVMMKVCSYPDWYPEHTLGTGEMALAVGLGYDWCYDAMTDEQRQFIAEQSMELGLGVGYDVYYGLASYNNRFWGKTDTNWGGHVNGGFITLAAAIAEIDMDYTMQSLHNSLRSMEYPIYAIAPDGAWHEGPSYWSYYFGPLAIGMAAYESVIGKEHEAVYAKGMDGMLTFQAQFTGPINKYNNYNDAVPANSESIARVLIGSKYGMEGIVKQSADNSLEGFSDSTVAAEVFNILWYNTDVTASDVNITDNLPLDAHYRETEFVSMRQNWNSRNALWASMTGGISNTSHSHLDSGSYVFALDGVIWATDLGTEAAYYSRTGGNSATALGLTNQHYYRRKAEGHNMVVINPDENLEIDPDARSEFSPVVSGIGRAYTTLDLTETYGDKVKSYIRGYLVSDHRRSFTVRDEINLANDNSTLYWFMHTDGDILILDNNTAVITQDGKQLYVQFAVDGDNVNYNLSKMAKKRLIDVGITETDNAGEKIALKLTASGKVNITVKMAMRNEIASQTQPDTTPIAEWTVEGDNAVATAEEILSCKARLSSIQVNGAQLFGFNPELLAYNVYTTEGSEIPEITAVAEGASKVLPYPQPDGTVMLEIRAYDDNGYYTPYTITIKYSKKMNIAGYSAYQVVGSDVSSEQTTKTTSQNNLRYGSYDGDSKTRWSALGNGEWIIHDLGEEKEVDSVAVAFYNGNSRVYSFDILVSSDGVNFTEVLKDRKNSGTTSEPEIYNFESTQKARYIKYVGYGSNVNEWNNVIELVSLKKK